MLRPLDVRCFPPLLLNLIGRRLPPFMEVLTRYFASILFNSASRVRLTPKTHLSIYIFFFPIWLQLRFAFFGLWAYKFRAIFPAFYSKNRL